MVADVGGTNTRLALFDEDSNQFQELAEFRNEDHESLEHVIEHWLEEHHPYDVPELVALKAEHVADGYLDWLRHSVSA